MSDPEGLGEGPLHESSREGPRQVVRSADQVPLHLPVAGPTSRMLAYLVDAVLIFLLAGGMVLLLALSTPLLGALLEPLSRLSDAFGSDTDALGGAMVLVVVAVLFVFLASEVLYFLFWELTNRGRTPGKALLGLRVVSDDGQPVGAGASLLRNLLRIVDYLPANYLTGFIAMLLSPQGKRLGDLAAGTTVVRLDRSEAVAPLRLEASGDDVPTFAFARTQVEQLGRTERALLRRTLRRVERLEPAQAEAVLARAVEVLRSRIGYPDEVEPLERAAFLESLLRAARR